MLLGGAGSLPKLCEPELENMRIEAQTAGLIEEAVRGRPRRVAGGDPLQVMPHLCILEGVPSCLSLSQFARFWSSRPEPESQLAENCCILWTAEAVTAHH